MLRRRRGDFRRFCDNFKIGTGLYFIVMAMFSSSIGDYLAGRLRTKWVGIVATEKGRFAEILAEAFTLIDIDVDLSAALIAVGRRQRPRGTRPIANRGEPRAQCC
jgi:hypothetical protein